MERNDKVKGGGKSYTTEFRQYDAQLGRWWSVDPLAHIVPGWTPYRAFFNNPIYWTDSHGNIEWPLKGASAQNKADAPGGGYGLTNTVIRTSTYQEIRSVGTSPHIGIDYRAAIGTPVYSLGDGEVTGMSTTGSGIIILEVRYGGETGDKIRFLHLSEYAEGIEVGYKVKEGQIIAYTGNSGGYPEHLHIDGKDSQGKHIDPEAKNYGRFTNEEFFSIYEGDYTKLPSSTQEAGASKGKPTYNAPGWAKNSLIGAHIYFIFTGKDPGFSDQENEELLRMSEGTD